MGCTNPKPTKEGEKKPLPQPSKLEGSYVDPPTEQAIPKITP